MAIDAKKLWEQWLTVDNNHLHNIFNTDGSKVEGDWVKGYWVPKGQDMKAQQLMENNVTMIVGNIDDPKSTAKTMNNAHKSPSFKGIKFDAKEHDAKSIKVTGPEKEIKEFIRMSTGSATFKIAENTTVNENPEFSDMHRVLIQIDNLHAQIERKITDLVNANNGDLTDQIITMDKLMEQMNAVIKRSFAIVPVDESIEEEITFENYALAAAEAHKAGKKEFEYPKGSGKMHKVTISPEAAKKITDEGYSKHKKGTKKYKQHMAAMHAAKAGK